MEDWKKTEKRTEVREGPDGSVTNVNVGPDSTIDLDERDEVEKVEEVEEVEEEKDIVDDPVGSTIIRQEETIEKHQR